jgi:hypothetical protein
MATLFLSDSLLSHTTKNYAGSSPRPQLSDADKTFDSDKYFGSAASGMALNGRQSLIFYCPIGICSLSLVSPWMETL